MYSRNFSCNQKIIRTSLPRGETDSDHFCAPETQIAASATNRPYRISLLEVLHHSIDENTDGSGGDQQNRDSQVSLMPVEPDDGAAFFLGGELNGIGDQIF